MRGSLCSPVGRMLISAILFVTLPATVFFVVQCNLYIDLTSNLKSSTSEAISAVATIITAHILIGYFLYVAYNYEDSKSQKIN